MNQEQVKITGEQFLYQDTYAHLCEKKQNLQFTPFEEYIYDKFEKDKEIQEKKEKSPKKRQARSISQPKMIVKKKINLTRNQTAGKEPIQRPQMTVTPVFDEKEEMKLKQLRKNFDFSNIYDDYRKEKKQFMENYVLQTTELNKMEQQKINEQHKQQQQMKLSKSMIKGDQTPKIKKDIMLTVASTTLASNSSRFKDSYRLRFNKTSTMSSEEKRQFLLEKKKQRIQNQKLEQERRQQLKNPQKTQIQQIDHKPQFPSWIADREQFKELSKSKAFDLNLKIVSICEIQTFNRDESQKTIVALYLQKLSLFKLMPYEMLLQIGGALTTQFYKQGDVICRQGDRGDCMYIIYKGEIGVEIKGMIIKVFQQNEHLGRDALETDKPRSATLLANKDTHLLLLSRWNYQMCLNNIFKIERPKWQSFLDQIHFFKNFPYEKITKLCSELKGKFMSPKDCLYKIGDPIDNFYIVKNGVLYKRVVVDMEKANRWPLAKKQWVSRTITTRLEVPLKYPPQSLLGYFEIVTADSLGIKARTETVDALTDCFVLVLPKVKFQEIFDADDQERFREHYIKTHPVSFDHLVAQVKKEEVNKIRETRVIEDAILETLQRIPEQVLEKKKVKYDKVIMHAKDKLQEFQDTKTILGFEERVKIIQSYYE